MSRWRHVRAIVLLPAVAIGAVPAAILATSGWGEVGWGPAALTIALGITLIGGGLALVSWTISLLARIGEGTLAPWDPTSTLVVAGPYRYLRNPMIAGVALVLAGEAALFGSSLLLVWAIAFGAVNTVWFARVEEPGLERRFGEDYRAYRASVPRWLPRRKPWTPG